MWIVQTLHKKEFKMECFPTTQKYNQYSSGFSIDNILRDDRKEKQRRSPSTEHISYVGDFAESWRRDDFIKRQQRIDDFYLRKDFPPTKLQDTEYWIRNSRIQRPKSLTLPTSFSCLPPPPPHDIDLVPSPSPTSSTWSPTSVFGRHTMESWFLNKVNSPSKYVRDRRRSPSGSMPSPYSSWNSSSSSSSDREAFSGVLRRHRHSPYFPTVDDDSDDSSRKGGQVRFTHSQSGELERVFNIQKYISPQERKQLAKSLDLSERQVKTWFQNRRAKWRRVKLEDEMRAQMTEKCLTRLSTERDAVLSSI